MQGENPKVAVPHLFWAVKTEPAARNAAEHIRRIARDRYSSYVMLVSLCYAIREMLLSDSAADAFGDLCERIATNSSCDGYPMRFCAENLHNGFLPQRHQGVLDEFPDDPDELAKIILDVDLEEETACIARVSAGSPDGVLSFSTRP